MALQVMKEMYKLRSQQVVYLAHPVHVENPKDRWGGGGWDGMACCWPAAGLPLACRRAAAGRPPWLLHSCPADQPDGASGACIQHDPSTGPCPAALLTRSPPLSHLAPRRVWLEIFEAFTKECPVLDPERSDLNKITPKQYTLSKGKVHKGRVKMVSRAGAHAGGGGGESGVTHKLQRLQRRLRGWLQGLM
jgi:hypothetical protein